MGLHRPQKLAAKYFDIHFNIRHCWTARAIDAFTQHGLRQHVSTPTRGSLTSGNILDLVLSLPTVSLSQTWLYSVQSVSFSDHHFVTCHLGVPLTPPVTTTYNYRPLRNTTITHSDDYAELFDAEVRRVLYIHAPLCTGRRRCGQHDIRQLSDEARQAKQRRRRVERRYRRTGLESDRRAYASACSAARGSRMKSRAYHIRAKLDEVSGDVGATWRAAQTTATEMMSSVTTNARNLCHDFLQVLRWQSKPHSQQHSGGTTVNSPERVHRQALPRSGVVVLPTGDNRGGAPTVVCHAVQVVTARRAAMLVTEGMHWHFLTSHRQARQPIDADWKVSVEIQAGAGTATTETGWTRPLIASELQAHIQSVNRLKDPWKTRVDTPASSSARVNQL